MKHILFLSCFFLLLLGTAQQQVDSLQQILPNQKGQEKVQTLNELSWLLRKKKDSSGIIYALKALELSKRQNYYLGISDAYNRLGGIAKQQGYVIQAKEYYEKALQIDGTQKYTYGIARANNQLGRIFKLQGKKLEAITHYTNSLDAFIELKKYRQATIVATNIGALYTTYNAHKEALTYYLKALDFSKNSNNSIQVADTYKNLGFTQKKLKNYTEALAYFQEAATIYHQKNALEKVANMEIAIAATYDHLNKNQEALQQYYKTLHLINTYSTGDKGALYHNLATLYKKLDKKDSAFHYYKSSIQEFISTKDKNKLLVSYNNVGNLLFDEGKYKKALDYLGKSLALQHNTKDSSMLAYTYSSMSKVYQQLRNYQKAYAYKDSSSQIEKDEFVKIKKADRYEVAYINEKKKLAAAISEQKITATQTEKKNITIIALLITVALLAILFFYMIKARKQKEKQLRITLEKEKQTQQIQELIKTKELNAIHAMINGQEKERKRIAKELHDNLGSKLSLVKIFYQSVTHNLEESAQVSYEKAHQLLDEACKTVREISHDMLSGTLSKFGLMPALQELKQTLESVYLEQDHKKISIQLTSYKLDFRLENTIEIQIYRVIQELLNNIIKHAQATEVVIQLLKLENGLNIIVEDNGIGFDTEKQHTGIGLKNISSRVQHMKGECKIDSGKGNGTTVTIDIPIKATETYES
ncbi:tetratricopeptide repeat-containing sensor histidine kinase [Tenacibaculum agarivorans]|uniref:tetratricopeptide repeat-containing sensor histidine kinase n=1 Tax=Tenacibaculum agarivorans TaxID=1908389 RepID=UPI0009FA83C7|nr:tetratricopeptide repeat protein [Tenacibaculum agarivorans]